MTPIATIKVEPGAAFVLRHAASLKPGTYELYDRAQVERMIAEALKRSP
ncbi:MAG: hypothetical protein RSG92_15225 [Pseudomonas sp.]